MSQDRQAAINAVLERYEQPAHRGTLPPPAVSAAGDNPRCGDTVTLYAEVVDGTLRRVRFEGAGCTISQAGADWAAELAQARPAADVLAGRGDEVVQALGLGPLTAARLECATLGWRTLQRALGADQSPRPPSPAA